MLKTERQEKILREIRQRVLVSVVDLNNHFDVSEITIRRDLDELEKSGLIERVHGGARLISRVTPEPPVLHRALENKEEKKAIAQKALEFIEEGDVIALESGSTALALAEEIAARKWNNLQIITNNFYIQSVLNNIPNVQLVFIGGLVDSHEMCTYGEMAELVLSRMRIRKYFSGCRGIHPDFGRSNEIHTGFEAGTVKAFLDISDQIILLADHTKFGQTFAIQILPPEKIDVIISSDLLTVKQYEPFQEKGISIVLAGIDETQSESIDHFEN